MADRVKAINTYRPKLKLEHRANMDEVLKYIEGNSGLNPSSMKNAIYQLRQAIIHYARMGKTVKVDELCTWIPSVKLDGTLRVGVRPDKGLIKVLNEGKFSAKVFNRNMMGKSPEHLIERWNRDHPDDPVGDKGKDKGKGKDKDKGKGKK